MIGITQQYMSCDRFGNSVQDTFEVIKYEVTFDDNFILFILDLDVDTIELVIR